MDPTDLSDDQLDALAQQLAGRLPTGTHGDRVVLSRRQFIGAATGVLSAGALTALGVDEAAAQAAGSVGTSSSPVNVTAYDLNIANGVTSSLPMNGNDIENAGSVSTDTMSTAVEWSQEAANRSFGTEYQAPDYDMLVKVTIQINTTTTDNQVSVNSGPSAADATTGKIRWGSGGKDGNDRRVLSAYIPANHYYSVAQDLGTDTTINQWAELR